MLPGVASTLEKHHRVQLLDEALDAAVQLSHRYIPARQLPDKAVSLIDTACARVAISQHATPPEVEDSRRRVGALEVERDILERESAVGIDHEIRRGEIAKKLEEENANLKRLDTDWQQEKEVVEKILTLRAKLRPSVKRNGAEPNAPSVAVDKQQTDAAADKTQLLADLKALEKELGTLQGETPLV